MNTKQIASAGAINSPAVATDRSSELTVAIEKISLAGVSGQPMLTLEFNIGLESWPVWRQFVSNFGHLNRSRWGWDCRPTGNGFRGTYECDGGGWWLPLGGATVAEILARTLCFSIPQYRDDLINQMMMMINGYYPHMSRGLSRAKVRQAVERALEIAGTAFQQLLNDAQRDALENGNKYFDRLPIYRGGMPGRIPTVEVEGFTPDSGYHVQDNRVICSAWQYEHTQKNGGVK